MKIKSLTLRNFRNFIDSEIVVPDNSLLVAAAANATGKTNFLEAVVMSLRGRSWRANHNQCVRWGQEAFITRAKIDRRDGETSLAVRYHLPTKKVRIEEDGKPVSSVTFYKRYPLVLFVAEDTFLFTRSPAQRRNFLNQALVTAPPYVSALVQYQRALLQRNSLLKNASSFEDVSAWTDLLVEHGTTLWKYRQQLIDYINAHLGEQYQILNGEELKLEAEFITTTNNPENFRDELKSVFANEKRYGHTLRGPHRDDIQLTSSGRPVAAVLSQGQMRGVIIALKFVVAGFIEAITEEKPLVLLDEVLSELDSKRQQTLLDNLPAGQVLLTCTSLPASLASQNNAHVLDLSFILQEEIVNKSEQVKSEATPSGVKRDSSKVIAR